MLPGMAKAAVPSATCEHCHEKERAESDNGEGPQEAPIHHTEKLACQSHKTEDDQKCARDQSRQHSNGLFAFHSPFHIEKVYTLPGPRRQLS